MASKWMLLTGGHATTSKDGIRFHFRSSRDLAHDITQSLSNIKRCAGRIPWTVHDHSVFVAYLLESMGHLRHIQILGLVHDFHEAYVGDIPSPMEALFSDVKFVKRKVQDHILEVLGEPLPSPHEDALVARADYLAWLCEAVTFLEGEFCPESTPGKLGIISPEMAEAYQTWETWRRRPLLQRLRERWVRPAWDGTDLVASGLSLLYHLRHNRIPRIDHLYLTLKGSY